jgi:hypothetical protein
MTSPFLVAGGAATLGHGAVRRGGESRRWECQRRNGEDPARKTGR